MKDEERARDYALTRQKNLHLSQKDTNLIQLAYLHGLKAGRPEWHKVADGDLPNNTRNVWTNAGPSYYDIEDHCWRDDFGRTNGVIAWCEPKFEETDQ